MWAALLIFVAACAHAPACPLPSGTPGAPFLWKVQRGDATVWLFGTVHNAGAGDIPPAALAALASSRRFASELGDLEPDGEKLRDLSIIRSGPGLDQLLPLDDWYDLRDALRGTVKEDDLKRVRPWYAMSRLAMRGAPPPNPIIDVALANRARDAHLPIDHLETWEQQMGALVDGVTIADLQETIHARKTMACSVATLRASYLLGDTAEMTRQLVVHEDGALLGVRNARWLPQLEAYLTRDGAFVAVGLGHLLGDHGIVAALQTAGYSVERAR